MGILTAAGKLEGLKRNGTESMYLVAASHSPDLWYPYLWMLGGSIAEYKDNHPKRGSYWFPTYNSSQGVRALEFLRDQVKVGIKPQVEALHQVKTLQIEICQCHWMALGFQVRFHQKSKGIWNRK